MARNALTLKHGEPKLGAATFGSRRRGIICPVCHGYRTGKQNEPDQYAWWRFIHRRITHLTPPFYGRHYPASIDGCAHRPVAGLTIRAMGPFFNGAPVEQVVRFLKRPIG